MNGMIYSTTHYSPADLTDELNHSSDCVSHRILRSASSLNLTVRRARLSRLSRLSTYSDRAFLVARPRVWNRFPLHVTSASSVNISKIYLKHSLLILLS